MFPASSPASSVTRDQDVITSSTTRRCTRPPTAYARSSLRLSAAGELGRSAAARGVIESDTWKTSKVGGVRFMVQPCQSLIFCEKRYRTDGCEFILYRNQNDTPTHRASTRFCSHAIMKLQQKYLVRKANAFYSQGNM